MTLKLNISTKDGKSWKLEADIPALMGKSIGDKMPGKEIKPELDGYELEIKGGSDKAGFPLSSKVEGIGLKRVLLTRGEMGMHKRARREGKKKVPQTKGLRLRKTVRGKTVSETTVQLNLQIIKEGSKKLAEIFPDQNKAPEPEKKEEAPAKETPAEKPAETPKEEKTPEKKEESKEESKPEEKKE